MPSHDHLPVRRRVARRVRVTLACSLLAASIATAVPAVGAPSDELADTRDRIAETLAELEKINGAAEQTEEELAAAAAQVERLEQDLNRVQQALQDQETRVEAARTEAQVAAADRDRIEEIVGARARRAFMGSDASALVVLGSGGPDDFKAALDGLALLDMLAARADASMETLDVARIRADAAAGVLDAEVAALEEVRATQEELLARAQEVMDERRFALRTLEAEQVRLMAEQEQLEEDEAEIQAIIDAAAAEARRAAEEAARAAAAAAAEEAAGDEADAAPAAPTAPPPPASGCYQWPANGAVTSEYGYRWGRQHKGIDIDGNTGDPLFAAQSGQVIYTGYYSGYGNLTLISHSDGVTTAYAHQSAFGVSQGQNVARGDYIGKMGATGNVTGSHLHFETRTSSGAVNPRNYLC